MNAKKKQINAEATRIYVGNLRFVLGLIKRVFVVLTS